eukprot:TRINITY_DN1934_c0_g1_i2.p1 TRINITY_DN1934_c0_g1~~TRINITY_DN1934_c0_g1_i2.p1  ORF type:complete len:444 (+),score=70.14 TRINITY_DN1934_c0_g1_i2:58-1389(+)
MANEPIYVKWLHEDESVWPRYADLLANYDVKEGDFESLRGFFRELDIPSGHLVKVIQERLSQTERNNFFSKTLPLIRKLALEFPQAFPEKIPFLQAQQEGSITLTRHQAACLLATAVLCLIPRLDYANLDLPGVDFRTFWSLGSFSDLSKKQCILHYFERLATEGIPAGSITFHRRVLPVEAPTQQDLEAEQDALVEFTVRDQGSIEDCPNMLSADFANEYLGGGVLQQGNVQEEIMFAECPECICGMLFCEVMKPNEAIILIGPGHFSTHTGYGGSFYFNGPHRDELPVDGHDRLCRAVVAIDAIVAFATNQFSDENLIREYWKAYCGFSVPDELLAHKYDGIATGNWGCGVFGGSIPLKAMLQWLAASKSKRPITYCTFNNPAANGLAEVVQLLRSRNVTTGQLWSMIFEYCHEHNPSRDRGQSLFRFLSGKSQKSGCFGF